MDLLFQYLLMPEIGVAFFLLMGFMADTTIEDSFGPQLISETHGGFFFSFEGMDSIWPGPSILSLFRLLSFFGGTLGKGGIGDFSSP
jgi:hypothetical protein